MPGGRQDPPVAVIVVLARTATVSRTVLLHRGEVDPAVTEPEEAPVTSLADVAAEPSDQSVARENELVGDAPDTGDVLPTDDAQ